MAERPTIPRISDVSPPLFNSADVRDRVGRTATAINLATDFANQSGAFREASPDTVENTTDISGLTTGAPVLVDTDAFAVETPGIVPAFTDGGFHYVDDMIQSKPIAGESTSDATARIARIINSRYELISTRTGNTINYATPANGFSRLQISNNTPTFAQTNNLRTDTQYALPVFPNTLTSRIRCIVEHDPTIDISTTMLAYDTNGRVIGRVHCAMWTPNRNNRTIKQIWPNLSYSSFNRASGFRKAGIEGLQNLPDRGVLVFEQVISPIGGTPRTPNGILGVNELNLDVMEFVGGHYATIEEAYANGGAGGAFACLEPDHPNYIGGGAGFGFISYRTPTSTERYVAGYHQHVMNVGNWHYIEVTAGDVKNDVMNRLVGIPPNQVGEDEATIAQREAENG